MAFVIIAVLWAIVPGIVSQVELVLRSRWNVVVVVIIIAWGIWKREHVPSMILN